MNAWYKHWWKGRTEGRVWEQKGRNLLWIFFFFSFPFFPNVSDRSFHRFRRLEENDYDDGVVLSRVALEWWGCAMWVLRVHARIKWRKEFFLFIPIFSLVRYFIQNSYLSFFPLFFLFFSFRLLLHIKVSPLSYPPLLPLLLLHLLYTLSFPF